MISTVSDFIPGCSLITWLKRLSLWKVIVNLVHSDFVNQGNCSALVTSGRLSTWRHLQLHSPRERDWNLAKQKGTVITLLCIFRVHTHTTLRFAWKCLNYLAAKVFFHSICVCERDVGTVIKKMNQSQAMTRRLHDAPSTCTCLGELRNINYWPVSRGESVCFLRPVLCVLISFCPPILRPLFSSVCGF